MNRYIPYHTSSSIYCIQSAGHIIIPCLCLESVVSCGRSEKADRVWGGDGHTLISCATTQNLKFLHSLLIILHT